TIWGCCGVPITLGVCAIAGTANSSAATTSRILIVGLSSRAAAAVSRTADWAGRRRGAAGRSRRSRADGTGGNPAGRPSPWARGWVGARAEGAGVLAAADRRIAAADGGLAAADIVEAIRAQAEPDGVDEHRGRAVGIGEIAFEHGDIEGGLAALAAHRLQHHD